MSNEGNMLSTADDRYVLNLALSDENTSIKNGDNYDTDILLEVHLMKMAALYEVASRKGISLAEADAQINLFDIDINTAERNFIDDAIAQTTASKPSFLMVSYNMPMNENGKIRNGKHWAVIAIEKNESGRITVSYMNSSKHETYLEAPEIQRIVSLTRKKCQDLDSELTFKEIHKEIQQDNCCGFSVALAVAEIATKDKNLRKMPPNEYVKSAIYRSMGRNFFDFIRKDPIDFDSIIQNNNTSTYINNDLFRKEFIALIEQTLFSLGLKKEDIRSYLDFVNKEYYKNGRFDYNKITGDIRSIQGEFDKVRKMVVNNKSISQIIEDRKAKDKRIAIPAKHFEDRTVAMESDFNASFNKPSGVSTGYIAKRNSDDHLFMMKKAIKVGDDIEIGNDQLRAGSFDTMSFVNEFVTAPLYKRMLYDRTPIIEAVETEETDIINLRSKFLHKFQTVSEFTKSSSPVRIGKESNKLKTVEGAEKLFAAMLFGGEYDMHAGNIGIMTIGNMTVKNDAGEDINKDINVYSKIDHGWSATQFFSGTELFSAPRMMMNNLANANINYGYLNTIDLNVSKFKQAIDEILIISDEEIETMIKARTNQLKSLGFDLRNLGFALWENDTVHNYDQAGPKPIYFNTYEELENHYINHYKMQKTAMKDFYRELNIIEKIEPTTAEWKNGNWLHEMKDYDPIIWAYNNNKKIGGLNPIVWAYNNNEKIERLNPITWKTEKLDPIVWAISNNRKIERLNPITWKIEKSDPIVWAASNNKKIEGLDSIAWAYNNNKEIEKLDPIAWAYSNNKKIEGLDPIAWAIGNNKKIEGLDPIAWAISNNKKIEGLDPSVWDKKSKLEKSINEAITNQDLQSLDQLIQEHKSLRKEFYINYDLGENSKTYKLLISGDEQTAVRLMGRIIKERGIEINSEALRKDLPPELLLKMSKIVQKIKDRENGQVNNFEDILNKISNGMKIVFSFGFAGMKDKDMKNVIEELENISKKYPTQKLIVGDKAAIDALTGKAMKITSNLIGTKQRTIKSNINPVNDDHRDNTPLLKKNHLLREGHAQSHPNKR